MTLKFDGCPSDFGCSPRHLEICHTGTVSLPPLKYKQYAVMRLFCEFRLDAPRADYISRYVGSWHQLLCRVLNWQLFSQLISRFSFSFFWSRLHGIRVGWVAYSAFCRPGVPAFFCFSTALPLQLVLDAMETTVEELPDAILRRADQRRGSSCGKVSDFMGAYVTLC